MAIAVPTKDSSGSQYGRVCQQFCSELSILSVLHEPFSSPPYSITLIMDSSSWKVICEQISPHRCNECKDIIFTSERPASFTLLRVERAKEAGCEFFRFAHQKYSHASITTTPIAPELIIYFLRSGGLEIEWVDGDTTLYRSTDPSTCELTMFAPEDSLASFDTDNRPLNLDPASDEQISRIRNSLRRCRQKHSKCISLREGYQQQCPARLIGVGDLNSKDVCISVPRSTSSVKYAVLSYRWGGDQESKTTTARLEQRCNGFPLAELPQTIQDAVFLTRRLGLQYLWVDAICIIQDDELDKDREIKIMDQIYRGASITIAAARAANASDGFLKHREPSQCYGTVCEIQYHQSSADDAGVRSCFILENPLHITFDDPIDDRGWTFQERYESFRTVRFGSKQTLWNCPTETWVDGGLNHIYEVTTETHFTGTIADPPYGHSLDDLFCNEQDLNSILGNWQELVSEYSRRKLSVRTDRLPAFAAMAKAFATFLGLQSAQYRAGLWDFDLPKQLQWRRPDYDSEEWNNWAAKTYPGTSPEKLIEPFTARSGPSWSWASVTGHVIFDHPRLQHGTITLNVASWDRELKTEGFDYGEVLWARLKVSGYMCKPFHRESKFLAWCPYTQEPCLLPLTATWDYEAEKPVEIWCLEIQTKEWISGKMSSGLLLTTLDAEIFKRVGYFEFKHHKLPSEMKGWNWFRNEDAYQTFYLE